MFEELQIRTIHKYPEVIAMWNNKTGIITINLPSIILVDPTNWNGKLNINPPINSIEEIVHLITESFLTEFICMEMCIVKEKLGCWHTDYGICIPFKMSIWMNVNEELFNEYNKILKKEKNKMYEIKN